MAVDVFQEEAMKRSNENYLKAVAHIMRTYQEKVGQKYPFNGKCGNQVKRILWHYGLDILCALWDEFLGKNWDWYDSMNRKVKVAHDLNIFEAKLTHLLEDKSYTKRLEAPRTDQDSKGLQSLKFSMENNVRAE